MGYISMKNFLSKKKCFVVGILVTMLMLCSGIAFASEEVEESQIGQRHTVVAKSTEEYTLLVNGEERIEVAAGEEITITASLASGNRMAKIDAYTSNKESLEVTETQEGTYTFVMPEEEVFVMGNAINCAPLARSATGQVTVTLRDSRYSDGLPIAYFEVNDGNNQYMAFCTQHEKKPPEAGWGMTVVGEYTFENQANELLRKVYYYGFGGPGNIGASFPETTLAGSVACGHMDLDDTGELEFPIGKPFVERVQDLPSPPKGFNVYRVQNLEDADYQYQTLAYWTYNSTGALELFKSSGNADVTSGNPAYSLKDAVYGLYSGDTQIALLTTDDNGYARADDIPTGTYELREVTAPKGYCITAQSSTLSVVINAGETAVAQVQDMPHMASVDAMLKKLDQEKNSNASQGGASLGEGEFLVQFFCGHYDTDPELQGISPARQWTLKTGEDGVAHLREENKVSGDAFFFDTNGVPALPLGTVTIKETKTPTGYLLNNTVFLQKIAEDGAGGVTVYNAPEIPEAIIRGGVKVQKRDSWTSEATPQGDAQLEGAKFDIINCNEKAILVEGKEYAPGATIKTLELDENGRAQTENNLLPYGDYKIKETTPPKGYLGAGIMEHAFQIRENEVVVDMTEKEQSIYNEVIRGGIKVQKRDFETKKKVPQGGATFAEATFDIINKSKNPVEVKGQLYQKNEKVMTLVLDANGTASTGVNDLPYGTYEIQESGVPNGYLGSGITKRTVEIREPGVVVDMTGEDQSIYNEVIRGDIEIAKFGASMSEASGIKTPLKGIEFTITSNTTGDSWVIVTDKNGWASTKQLDLSDRGNLPFDSYTISETKTPEGYGAISDMTDVRISEEGVTLKYIAENTESFAPIRVVKKDAETGNTIPRAGAKFQILDENKDPIELVVSYYPHVVKASVFETDESGTFTFPQVFDKGTYYLKEVQAPEGYLLQEELLEIRITQMHSWENPLEIEFFDDNAKGSIELKKYEDGKKELLKDAIFEVRAAVDIVTPDGTIRLKKGEVADTVTTTGEDAARTKPLYLGTYIVKEVKQPDGYVYSDKEYEIELKYKDDETAIVLESQTIYNHPTTLIWKKIKKAIKGEKEVALADVKYQVWNENTPDDKEIYTTDEKGTFTVQYLLPESVYCIQEMETSEGYILDETIHRVSVDKYGKIEGDGTHTVKVENDYTKIRFSKQDITTEKEIEGAKMTLWKVEKNGNRKKVETWVSKEEPHYMEGLQVGGTYVLEETHAPKGYLLASEIKFKVKNTGEIQTIVMKDETAMGQIKLIKKEKDKEKQLAGAVFEIRAGEDIITAEGTVRLKKGELADTITSTAKGSIKSKELFPGSYIVKEVKAPEGYALSDEEHKVEIKYKDQNTPIVYVTLTVQNQPTELIIEKYRKGTNIGMKGVKFKVWQKDQEENKDKKEEKLYETDKDGCAKIVRLKPNTVYCVQEVETLKGYVLDSTIHEIKVDEVGRIAGKASKTLKLTNDFTKVEISKVDMTTKEELPGARLELRDKEGKLIDRWTSAKTPHYIERLFEGEYSLIETDAPSGYLVAEEVKFTVESTGAIQKVVMKDERKPALLKESDEGPKTGDKTNVWIFILAFLVGAITMIVISVRKIYFKYRK